MTATVDAATDTAWIGEVKICQNLWCEEPFTRGRDSVSSMAWRKRRYCCASCAGAARSARAAEKAAAQQVSSDSVRDCRAALRGIDESGLSAPRRDWHEQAACLGSDTEVWFRESDTRPAVAICRRCPVQVDCLLDALRTSSRGDTTGIRGGTTPRVRHLLRTEIRRRGGAT